MGALVTLHEGIDSTVWVVVLHLVCSMMLGVLLMGISQLLTMHLAGEESLQVAPNAWLHENCAIWSLDLKTNRATRIGTGPYGSSSTSVRMYSNVSDKDQCCLPTIRYAHVNFTCPSRQISNCLVDP